MALPTLPWLSHQRIKPPRKRPLRRKRPPRKIDHPLNSAMPRSFVFPYSQFPRNRLHSLRRKFFQSAESGESMDSAKRSRVEAWLQYGNDLGLGPYFVTRTESAISSTLVSAPSPSTSMNMAPAAKFSAKSVAAAAGR